MTALHPRRRLLGALLLAPATLAAVRRAEAQAPPPAIVGWRRPEMAVRIGGANQPGTRVRASELPALPAQVVEVSGDLLAIRDGQGRLLYVSRNDVHTKPPQWQASRPRPDGPCVTVGAQAFGC